MATEDHARNVADALSVIHETGEQVRERELRTALTKLDDLDERERAVLEALAGRLVEGVLAPPTRSLLTAAADADRETVETALALFGDADPGTEPDDVPSTEPASPGVARARD